MNTQQAVSILQLTTTQPITLNMVKSSFRKLMKAYHPDINPSGHHMTQLINNAYDHLSKQEYPLSIVEEMNQDLPGLIQEAINSILGLEGLSIEICGIWVWVTGKTKEHKDHLKSKGFRFSGAKKAWYFNPDPNSTRKRGFYSNMSKIREKFGSEKIENKKRRYTNLAYS